MAEKTSFKNHSVDLITVAEALHWFDLPKFYQEVKRILKPDGLLAVWCYKTITTENKAIHCMLHELYWHTICPYWPKEHYHIDNEYKTISFPFPCVEHPPFFIEKYWTCEELIGYLSTSSGARTVIQKKLKLFLF